MRRRGVAVASNPVVRRLDVGAGIALSPYLLGMHFHRWPEGSPLSSAPTYGFGAVRRHDYSGGPPGTAWNKIHTAPGVIDWTNLDVWVNTHHAAGRRTLYTLYGTPSWIAADTNPDAYGAAGGASPPSDSATGYPVLQDFITALINRYNDGTPQGRKIWGIETWNEPNFNVNQTGFWWGTATELVDMTRAIVLARNASADPGVKVLSPGFVDWDFPAGSRLDTWLGASSALEPATKGKDWINIVALHLYGYGYDQYYAKRSDLAIANARARMATHGISGLPIQVTEEGASEGSGADGTWDALTDAQRGAWMARHVILQGLWGVETVYLYAHDNTLSGDFRKPELANAINRVHTEVAGKTITSAQFRMDGSLELIADGDLVRI